MKKKKEKIENHAGIIWMKSLFLARIAHHQALFG